MKTDISVRQKLHDTALQAPQSSGVYLWRDTEGTILYVGKAKSLKNRLSSYFSGQKDIKTRILISRAFSIEYITTSNEYEALILENTLIKQHCPRYNINLKDDKSYPVVRITNEKFPRVIKTRRILQDGSQYFGPFPNAGALNTFMEVLYSLYPLRQCKKLIKKTSPCMYYHIDRCSAPCCGKISTENYNSLIGEIASMLEGKPEETLKKLEDTMKEAATEFKYEKAARLRDGIQAFKNLRMQNAVVDFDPESRDYIGYFSEGPFVSFAILKMRSGKLVMRDLYRTKSMKNEIELLTEFLMAYYTTAENIPPRIYVPAGFDSVRGNMEQRKTVKEETKLVEKWIQDTWKLSVDITTLHPNMTGYGRHEASMNMARHNAKEDILRRMKERSDTPGMTELQKVLNLPHLPVRIEGFDIAHIGGKFPVASLISFYNGNPDKKNYRSFRLKTTDGIVDDFASMREVTSRRYTRLLNEQGEMPDLIMIDGGIGQVNAVQGVLDALGLNIPIIGLAEKNEELYFPGNSTPLVLPRRSEALRLLQRVRDETHRFATSKNQALRTKENIVSVFEELPHVGKKRAALLLSEFTTLETLASSKVSTIAEKLIIPENHAGDILAAAKILQKERAKKIAEKANTAYGPHKQIVKPESDDYIGNLADLALGTQVAADSEQNKNYQK